MHKKYYAIFLLLCAALFMTGCAKTQVAEAIDKVQTIVPVKANRVKLTTINKTLDYVGDIKAQDEAVVYPKVNGKIIEKLRQDGDRITKGEVIAYVDRDEVGFTFEKAPVESPLTGIIGRIYVDIGTNVTQTTPVALVVNMDNVKIELNIPEQYLPKVAPGQFAEVALQAYPDEKFKGIVSKVSPVLDIETRTAPIEIVILNSDHRLKSGMFAQVRLIIEEHQKTPVIIKEAVMGKAPQEYVYVIEDNVAHLRNIKLGIKQGAFREVTEGLKENDIVVIMGQQKLYESASVNVEIEGENNK